MFVSTVCLASDLFASGVFKCIDENGQTTFAFAPCASKKITVKKEQDIEATVDEQMAALEIINGRISRINRQFRNLRLEREQNLQTSPDPGAQKQIRDGYRQHTSDLLDQLSELKSERSMLVDRSMSLLSRSDEG